MPYLRLRKKPLILQDKIVEVLYDLLNVQMKTCPNPVNTSTHLKKVIYSFSYQSKCNLLRFSLLKKNGLLG
jgi:hypothetical protein